MIKSKKTQSQSDSKSLIVPLLTQTELSLPRMSSIQLAMNNTFVAYKWNEQQYKATLMHVGEDGEVLASIDIQSFNNNFCMINECQVLFFTYSWQTRVSYMSIWNLITNNVTKTALQFEEMYSKNTSTQYLFFYQTQILCEAIKYKDKQNCRITLKYYRLPLKNGQKVFHSYVYNCEDINEVRIKKLNNKNLLAFIPSKFDIQQENMIFEGYQVSTEELKQEGILVPFKIGHGFKNNIEDTQLTIRISDMWQIQQGNYYIQMETSVDTYHLYKNRGKDIEKGLIQKLSKQQRYHNFYWSVSENLLTEMKLNIPTAHRVQFLHKIRNLQDLSEKQYWSLSKRLTKLTSRHKSQRQNFVRVPIYYFNLLTEQVLAMHRITPKEEQHTLYWPQYEKNSSRLMQSWTENKNQPSQTMVVQIRKIPQPYDKKILSAFFILQVIQGCDQYLMDDAITLLE